MKDLPEDWETVKLLDIANISAGGTPRRNIQEYWKNGDIPWLKISDLKETYIKKSKEYITQSGLDNSSTKLFPKGTIVYSIFATLGAVGILDIQTTTNQAIAGIIPNNEIIDSKYLYYCLISEKNKICAKKSHATQDNINLTILRNHEIPLPPLPTQKKIIAILEKAEQLKEWRREADEMTDELLKSTFLEMFGDPVKNPKGWEMRNLGEVAEVSSGLTLNSQRRANKENLFPYLRVANVYRNKLDLNEIKYIHVSDLEFERFLLKKNDVLIVEGHGNIEEIGRAAIWNGEIPNCLHQNHIIKVRLNDNYISPSFLSFFLNFYGNYGYFSSKSRTTSGLNTISTNKVRKAKIPLPPVSMQKKFAEIYKSIEQLREHQTQSHQHIYDLFNALVQQAFRGELSI